MPQELYEDILRNAFSYQFNGNIDRAGDPARLADTDEYYEDNINRVKIGLGYTMEIFFADLRKSVNQCEIDRINNFSVRLISAPDLTAVEQIITDFNTSVFTKYYTMVNGIIPRI